MSKASENYTNRYQQLMETLIGTQKPIDLYWGCFCSPICFLNENKETLYYNKEKFADLLNEDIKNPKFHNLSKNKEFVYIRERDPRDINNLRHTVINLKTNQFKSVAGDPNSPIPFPKQIEDSSFLESDLETIKEIPWENNIQDKLKLKNWLGMQNWKIKQLVTQG